MDYLKVLMSIINGKKTYVVAGTTVLYAVIYYALTLHQYGNALDMILGASGLGALRHGVAKTAPAGPANV